MVKITLAAAMLAATVIVPMPTPAADQAFNDTVCEKASPVGRRLNDLVSKNDSLTPELLATALEMRDVYADCVTGYDRDSTSRAGHGGEQYGSTNAAIVGRLYARLALAQAEQRVAEYEGYDKKFDDAAAALADANKRLNEMEGIEPFAQAHSGTPERRLLARAQDVRATLATAATNLAERRASAPKI